MGPSKPAGSSASIAVSPRLPQSVKFQSTLAEENRACGLASASAVSPICGAARLSDSANKSRGGSKLACATEICTVLPKSMVALPPSTNALDTELSGVKLNEPLAGEGSGAKRESEFSETRSRGAAASACASGAPAMKPVAVKAAMSARIRNGTPVWADPPPETYDTAWDISI